VHFRRAVSRLQCNEVVVRLKGGVDGVSGCVDGRIGRRWVGSGRGIGNAEIAGCGVHRSTISVRSRGQLSSAWPRVVEGVCHRSERQRIVGYRLACPRLARAGGGGEPRRLVVIRCCSCGG